MTKEQAAREIVENWHQRDECIHCDPTTTCDFCLRRLVLTGATWMQEEAVKMAKFRHKHHHIPGCDEGQCQANIIAATIRTIGEIGESDEG